MRIQSINSYYVNSNPKNLRNQNTRQECFKEFSQSNVVFNGKLGKILGGVGGALVGTVNAVLAWDSTQIEKGVKFGVAGGNLAEELSNGTVTKADSDWFLNTAASQI